MSDISISINNLSKKYMIGNAANTFPTLIDCVKSIKRKARKKKYIWALKDVNVKVKRGEIVGIIGKNGAGKSTFLKLISRISRPTAGKINVNGRLASLLEVGTGFHPELTGRENIFFNGAILGMKRKDIKRVFDSIVEFSELLEFIDTPVKFYSSGMYVRLAFAVAAYLDHDIMLVDEVLAVGDMEFQKKCLGKIKNIANTGRTILFASHDLAAIQSLCSRVLVLDSSNIVADLPPDQAIEYYYSKMINPLFLQKISHRTDRTGSGDVFFEDIFFENDKGERIDTLFSGQSVVVCLAVRAIKDVSKLQISFGIHGKHGVPLFRIDSAVSGMNYSLREGKTIVRCKLPSLALSSGTYTLGARLYRAAYDYDLLCDAITFFVAPGDFWGSGFVDNYAPVLVPAEWIGEFDKNA